MFKKFIQFLLYKLQLVKIRTFKHRYMSYQGWAWSQIKIFFPGMKIALSEGQLSYTLTEKNIKYLASALSLVTKKDYVDQRVSG